MNLNLGSGWYRSALDHHWNPPAIQPTTLCIAILAFVASCLLTQAAPRPAWPPWPEQALAKYRFDDVDWHTPMLPPAIGFENALVQESWSEYALIRDGVYVAPVAIPVIDSTGRDTLAPTTGSVRFWFTPLWTSANEGGAGPGYYARLLELVDLTSNPNLRWSLYVSQNGDALFFTGTAVDGKAKNFLAAEVSFVAGEWQLITLNYSPAGSELWIGGQLVAEGLGVPAPTVSQIPSVGLILGSDVEGAYPAGGQFEEVTTFDYWPDPQQLLFYYNGVSRKVFLGSIGSAEEEAMKHELLAAAYPEMMTLEEGGGAMQMGYSYGSNELWLEIIGVTNGDADVVIHTPLDAPYDVFMTTNLSSDVPGLNLTNWARALQVPTGQTNISVPVGIHLIAFYRLGLTNDSDGDGLTDAYENLVSHSNPGLWDSDSDALPDGWEWMHFGNFSETAGGDHDEDGSSNLEEYGYGTDPNTISFSLKASSKYTSNSGLPLTVDVLKGTPYSVALLVDDTNFASATWTECSSTNLTVDIGGTEGWHHAWAGLRGRLETSQQTWAWKRLKLDQTPPSLSITSPTNETVSTPMVQLLGYSPESLAQISCDLTNAGGVFTNQMILLLDRHHDTNAWEFTTNTFQVFDVVLTNGVNTLLIYATDLAGNMATSNFSFTLDYSDKTNPPTIEVFWPQDGTRISGDTFVWRGRVEDPTVSVSATSVDQGGNTNSYIGQVERNGNYWVDGMILADGNNALTLTATDAVGNSTVTNITVLKSSLILAMDPVSPPDRLWQPTVDLTGVISDGSYAVWVNGVKGTNHGDGTWSAADVPVTAGGVANFAIAAYDPTEQQPDGSYGN